MIKKTAKIAGRKILIAAKKTAVRIPAVRRVGVKVKHALFPELANLRLETYNLDDYYPSIPEYMRQMDAAESFKIRPLISLVIPTYNTPDSYLRDCLDSVLYQSYKNWELCIADDASPDKQVMKTIREYAAKDKRIKFVERKENGHISKASNSAAAIAKGDFIGLLDHDDVLWPNALYEVAKAINENPEADMIYSDEDKIASEGRHHSYPFFKPDWSPEFLESCNYITHFTCIRTSVFNQIGGFRPGYEGAQDWDLFIRIGEKTDHIVHIPKLLYSWRVHKDSTAHDTDAKPYVYKAQRALLEDHLKRLHATGTVKQGIIKQHSTIAYDLTARPLVSVVVYAEQPDKLKRTINALNRTANYQELEFIVVSPHDLAKSLAYGQFIKLATGQQTPAAGFNLAAQAAGGQYLVFTNDNLTEISERWVELLLGEAQRQGIGVVGCRILDKQKKQLRHAGIAIGIHGVSANLLDGVPKDDTHYLRALFADSRRNVSALNGICLMLSKDIFAKAGGFDEQSGNLYDIDLCLSVLEAGYRNVYNPNVAIVDVTDRRQTMPDKEHEAYFKQKWSAYIQRDPYYNVNYSLGDTNLSVR